MSSRRAGGVATNSFLHRLLVRRRGKRDGRAQVPAVDDKTPSPYEKQLLNRGSQHIAQAMKAYAVKIREIQAAREAAIERFRLLTDRFVEESRRYDARRTQLGRDVIVHHMSRNWYQLILILIGTGEFALNTQAFEIFQKPTILTWLMALAVAVGIPAVAHFCGIWIKQWPKPAWRTGVNLAVTIAGTIGCLVGINVARRAYLGLQGLSLGREEEALERAFLAINIFVFLSATVLSYFAHDQDQELEILHKRVSKLDRKLDAIDSAIHKLGGELDKLKASQAAELQEIQAIVRELVNIYRGENLLARGDGRKPKVFDADPTLSEPDISDDTDRATAKSDVDQIRKKRLVAKSQLAQTEPRP